ncbi:hypothetical protein EMCRGX_G018699 [Ephydatia muelleri]
MNRTPTSGRVKHFASRHYGALLGALVFALLLTASSAQIDNTTSVVNLNTSTVTINVLPGTNTTSADCAGISVAIIDLIYGSSVSLTGPAVHLVNGSFSCSMGAAALKAIEKDALFNAITSTVYLYTRPGNGIYGLSSFVEFNLNQGLVTLSFSEVVDVGSLMLSKLAFQNNFMLTPTLNYTLTGGMCSGVMGCSSGVSVQFQLSTNDLNGIKTVGVCTSASNCVPNYQQGFVADFGSNPIGAFSLPANVPVHTPVKFINDTTPPTISSYILDLNANILLVTFSEPVQASTIVNASFILLSNIGTNLSLSTATLVDNSGNPASGRLLVVGFQLDPSLLVAIKPQGLFMSVTTTFLTVVANNSFADTSNNWNNAVNSLQAAQIISDTSASILNGFTLDLNSSLLILSFNNVMNPNASLPGMNVIIQNSSYAIPSMRYTLTTSTVASGPYSTTITILLSAADVNSLIAHPNIAKSINSSYVALGGDAFYDYKGKPVTFISNGDAVKATRFVQDFTPPSLISFSLNMNTGQLVLSFTKPMNYLTSFVPYLIQLQPNATNGSAGVILTSISAAAPSPYTMVMLQLSAADLNAIKNTPGLATLMQNTYLYMSTGAASDRSGNQLQSTYYNVTAGAIQATALVPDTTPPTVQSFVLDMNTGTVLLTFSEFINGATLMPLSFTLFSSVGPSAVSVSLAGATFTVANSDQIALTLPQGTLDFIKANQTIGTSVNSTYLGHTAAAYYDLLANMALALNRNSSCNEAVNISSLTPPSFNLINATSGAISSYPLNGTATVDGTYLNVVLLQLSSAQALAIKSNPFIATSAANTFLKLSTGAVLDMSRNPIQAATLMASYVSPDTSGPLVSGFNLDMNTGILILHYLEPVMGNLFAPTYLTLQDASSASYNYTLVSGTSFNLTLVSNLYILLQPADLNAIKAIPGLCTTLNNTYLSLGSGVLRDSHGNPVQPIPNGQAIKVGVFVGDTSPATLLGFDIVQAPNGVDVILQVRFSETVNASSADPTQFSLTYSLSSGNQVALSSLTVIPPRYSNVVSIYITSADLQTIKAMPPLGQTNATSYLTINSTAIFNLVPLASPSLTVMANVVSADLIPPSLASFSLDMNTGILSLTYSETVITSTLTSSKVVIQASVAGPTANYTLSTNSVPAAVANNSVVNIKLSFTDLEYLKLEPTIATSVNNTYVSLLPGSVQDLATNLASSTNTTVQARTFTLDTTNPMLVAFDLDMNTGVLTLQFDEAVRVSTFQARFFEVQSDAGGVSGLLAMLMSSMTSSPNGYILTVVLGVTDMVNIERQVGLAKNRSTTFMAVLNYAIMDMSGNWLWRISNYVALQVRNYTADITNPYVVTNGFSFDMNTGSLNLTFNQAIQSNLVQPSYLTLSNAMLYYNLTSPNTDLSNDQYINLTLSTTDINYLKVAGLCTSALNCNISLRKGAATNFVFLTNNNTQPIAVYNFTRDYTPPSLLSFATFNLRNSSITLQFSEPVNTSSFDPTGLTLQTVYLDPLRMVTLTNTSTISSNVSDTVTIYLSPQDLGTIKKTPYVCKRRYDCYITINSTTIKDLSGNPVNAIGSTMALIAMAFVLDVDNPNMETFTLDLNTGYVQLTFNEPVSYSSLVPKVLSFQSNQSGSQSGVTSYTLTGGQSIGPDDVIVSIALSATDLNALKATPNLAVNVTNGYAYFPATLVTDLAVPPLNVVPVPFTAAISGLIMRDETPPTISEFQLDFTLNQLILTFSEPVRPFTLTNLTLLTISSANASSANSRQLTGGQVLTTADGVTVVAVALNNQDRTFFKLNKQIATNISNTYLSVGPYAIIDMSGNQMLAVKYARASAFVPDTRRPQLTQFSLDMNTGVMTLTFDDTMLTPGFDPTAFRIQNALRASGSKYYTLQSSTVNSTNGSVLVVQLSDADFLGVKSVYGLARTNDTTWLTMQAFALENVAHINVLAIVDGKAIMVTTYISDTTPLQLQSFILDLNKGALLILFDDFPDVNTVSVRNFTIQSDTTVGNVAGQWFTLSGGSASLAGNGRTLNLTLSQSDANLLRNTSSIGKTINNTYLAIAFSAVSDYFGNPMSPLYPNGSAIRAANVTGDTTLLQVLSFDLDMNTGVLTLHFSKTYMAGTFNVSGLTLQGSVNSTLRPDSYTLTGYSSLAYISLTDLQVTLSSTDLNAIKMLVFVAKAWYTTYLSVTSGVMYDTSINPTKPITVASCLGVSVYISDISAPSLSNFTLDMNTGALLLTFSETIDVRTLVLSMLQFTNQASWSPTLFYRLTGGAYSQRAGHPDVVSVNLTSSDLNGLKAVTNLASGIGNTYLQFNSTLVADFFGNPVVPSTGLQVSMFTADTTPPTLLSFSLDMNTGVVTLSFSETIVGSSLNLSQFTIQSNASGSLTGVSLVNTTVAGNTATYSITLGVADLNSLKLNLMGLSSTTTSLTYLNGSARDAAGNNITAPGVAIPVNVFVADITRPQLLSFVLDYGFSGLILTFSEPADVSTLIPTAFTLQSGPVSPWFSFRLTSVSQPFGSMNGVVLKIKFGMQDLNVLNSFNNLAKNISNTYLSVLSTGVQDMAGNAIKQIPSTQALQASKLVPDTVPPVVQNFTLDLNTGTLVLVFSKTVMGNSLLATTFTFQNATSGPLVKVQLSAFQFPGVSDIQMTVTLSSLDLDSLKDANFSHGENDTFLNVNNGFGLDVSSNPGQASLITGIVILDTTPPYLVSFDFDLDQGTMTLHFNEAINLASFNVSEVVLLSQKVNYLGIIPTFTPTSITASRSLYRNVLVTFSSTDLNQIKKQYPLCNNNVTCFLHLLTNIQLYPQSPCSSYLVTNIAGYYVNCIDYTASQRVANFTPDTTPPKLVAFSIYDLDKGIIQLQFDETVNASSISMTALHLDDWFEPTQNLHSQLYMTGGVVVSGNEAYVRVNLSTTDINSIKINGFVCASASTCWVRFGSSFAKDMSGNAVTVVVTRAMYVGTELAQSYTYDMTSPQILSYSFDLNTGTFVFTFDEPVNPTTLQPHQLTVQNATNITVAQSYLVGFGTPSETVPSIVIHMTVFPADLIAIKAAGGLATSLSTTYISATSSFVRDVSPAYKNTGNPLRVILNVTALQASNFTLDSTPPILVQFSQLDMNTGTLRLSFNEPVTLPSFNAFLVHLQSMSTGGVIFNLTAGTIAVAYISADKTQVQVLLSATDLRNLKLNTALATRLSNSYLYVDSGAIQDFASNTVVASSSPLPVTSFIPDTTHPQVTYFLLDMNKGQIVLSYDDILNLSTFNVMSLQLQNASSNAAAKYSLTTSTPDPVNGYVNTSNAVMSPTVSYTLRNGTLTVTANRQVYNLSVSIKDLNQIKAIPSLGKDVSDTFITITMKKLLDTSGNMISLIPNTAALQASTFVQNTISPYLLSYSLDLNVGTSTSYLL